MDATKGNLNTFILLGNEHNADWCKTSKQKSKVFYLSVVLFLSTPFIQIVNFLIADYYKTGYYSLLYVL